MKAALFGAFSSGLLVAGASMLPANRSLVSSGDYGWVALVVLPFFMGLASTLCLGFREPIRFRDGAAATLWALIFATTVILALRWDGLVCLLMAAPLILPIALIGSAIGLAIHHAIRNWRGSAVASYAALALPLGASALLHEPTAYEEREVATIAWVAAPPDRIWSLLQRIDRLPEPRWWGFRMGIAYLKEVRSDGKLRICVLSTGDMPERITDFEPNRRLEWQVLQTPPIVRETNPFGEVHAPHDRQRLIVHSGGWRLVPEKGGTRIHADSKYAHRFGAPLYWNLWTDEVVRQVQLRAIEEIARRVAGS